MPRYRIFVVFHDTLTLEYYHESVLDCLVFVNVNPHNPHEYPSLNVINLYEFECFVPLGKWYTESEVIYNVFRNPQLYADADFVGFLQYDVDASPLRHEHLLALMQQAVYLSFEPHRFRDDYAQNILMDPAQPNVLRGNGKNCYLGIFEDFNRHYDTRFVVQDWMGHSIGLCSCFLVKRALFDELMTFVEGIIQRKKLDAFDTRHQYRIQGGLLERYYAIWFLLKQIPLTPLRLQHHYAETKRQNTLLRRLTDKLRGLLKR
jgi:hypothetical protein